MKDAFGNELKIGDPIIVAVPLHWNGTGYKLAKGRVARFTKNFVVYENIKNGPFSDGCAKASADKVAKSFEPYVPNCVV